MKNIIKFSALFFAILFLSSCEDIDQVNPNALDKSDHFKDREDIMQSLNAVYGILSEGTLYGSRYYNHMLVLSDEGSVERASGEMFGFAQFNETPDEQILPFYTTNYALIANAFELIDYLPVIGGDTRIEGEMEFLIALGYFNLLNYFGEELAVVDRAQTIFDVPVEAAPGEIATLIETKLLTAIDKLPLKSELAVTEYGRATRGAARMLLAKHYMQLGSIAGTTPSTPNWAGAEAQLKFLVVDGEGGYDLLTDFANNFTEQPAVNNEAIFLVNFTNSSEGSHGLNKALGIAEVQGAFADVQATTMSQTVFDVETIAGLSKDSRMDHSIFHADTEVNYYGQPFNFWSAAAKADWAEGLDDQELVGFYKYTEQVSVAANSATPNVSQGFNGGTDIIVFRYADALLMYAECLEELGVGTPLTYVDLVRTRSGRPASVTAYPTFTNMEHIMRERILELTGEGIRFYDMKRWGQYNATAAISDPDFANFVTGQDKNPIPLKALRLNPNLEGNDLNVGN